VRPIGLDDVDRRLLELLQRDYSKTLFQLGQEVRLSTSAVQRRIRRFERAGLIERQAAVLNAEALGELVLALVLVTLERESTKQHAALRRRLEECPGVQQCYGLAGQHDYAVVLAARGMSELSTLRMSSASSRCRSLTWSRQAWSSPSADAALLSGSSPEEGSAKVLDRLNCGRRRTRVDLETHRSGPRSRRCESRSRSGR
jgi:Lrp/AsnC family transcriptional regulator, leucine-responsive regulatory protein